MVQTVGRKGDAMTKDERAAVSAEPWGTKADRFTAWWLGFWKGIGGGSNDDVLLPEPDGEDALRFMVKVGDQWGCYLVSIEDFQTKTDAELRDAAGWVIDEWLEAVSTRREPIDYMDTPKGRMALPVGSSLDWVNERFRAQVAAIERSVKDTLRSVAVPATHPSWCPDGRYPSMDAPVLRRWDAMPPLPAHPGSETASGGQPGAKFQPAVKPAPFMGTEPSVDVSKLRGLTAGDIPKMWKQITLDPGRAGDRGITWVSPQQYRELMDDVVDLGKGDTHMGDDPHWDRMMANPGTLANPDHPDREWPRLVLGEDLDLECLEADAVAGRRRMIAALLADTTAGWGALEAERRVDRWGRCAYAMGYGLRTLVEGARTERDWWPE